MKVAKVDTDKYPDLAMKLEIDGLPTCVLFKGGEPVLRLVGMMPADKIKEEIAKFL